METPIVTVIFKNGYERTAPVSIKRAFFLQDHPRATVPEDAPIFTLHTMNAEYFVPGIIYLNIAKPLILPENQPLNKRNLYDRDKGICGYCSSELSFSKATMDHIIPKSRGGKHRWKNVVLSCIRCNTTKGSRTPEEAGLTLKITPTIPKNGRHY